MSRILLVASDPNELKGLDGPWDKAICGVGPINAAAYTAVNALKYNSEVVVSVGSCGSLGRLKVGDVVSFSTLVTPDQDMSALHLSLGTTIGPDRATFKELYTLDKTSPYILYSSGTFNSAVIPSHTLLKADAADMEAYGVGVACRALGLCFYAVKLVTDIVGEKVKIGDVSAVYREGRARLGEVLSSILLSS